MQDIELYTKLLGIRAPWSITGVQVSLKDRSVTISVSYDESIPVACPVCSGQASIYDHQKRRWRHLDTMQFMTIIECDVPRASCEDHGVKQLPVAWAEVKGRFTAVRHDQRPAPSPELTHPPVIGSDPPDRHAK